jgi:hypothetical protein
MLHRPMKVKCKDIKKSEKFIRLCFTFFRMQLQRKEDEPASLLTRILEMSHSSLVQNSNYSEGYHGVT